MKDAPESIQNDWPLFYLKSDQVKSPGLRQYLDKRKDEFVIQDNKVFHLSKIDDIPESQLVPYVPFSQRADLVANYHESNGHAGLETMIKLFNSRFWWHTVRRDLKHWLKTCPACQVNSRRRHIHRNIMHPLKVPAAFDRWHLDFVGELPLTTKGNRWLRVAVDYATNWPIARAVPQTTKETIADFIYDEIMMRFGCP